jgi:hypothetical protein
VLREDARAGKLTEKEKIEFDVVERVLRKRNVSMRRS